MNAVRDQIKAIIGTPADRHEPNGYELAILAGLQLKPTYQGTVDPATVVDRRRRNKQARRSRRINRLAAR